MAHLARCRWKAQHDTADRRGRHVDGNAFAALRGVSLPSARVSFRFGRVRVIVEASVEDPRLLKDEVGHELGTVPWSFPVLIAHIHQRAETISIADRLPGPLQPSRSAPWPRRRHPSPRLSVA